MGKNFEVLTTDFVLDQLLGSWQCSLAKCINGFQKGGADERLLG